MEHSSCDNMLFLTACSLVLLGFGEEEGEDEEESEVVDVREDDFPPRCNNTDGDNEDEQDDRLDDEFDG